MYLVEIAGPFDMKVLISAYSCMPDRGSEPGIGWNFSRLISQVHDVYVITNSANRQAIEQGIKKLRNHKLKVFYVNIPAPFDLFIRGKSAHLHYYLWQYLAFACAKKLHREIHFDLAQHLTYGTWRFPSFLWKLGIPFIWGPVGGAENWPKCILAHTPYMSREREGFRLAHQRFAAMSPGVRATARNACISIAVNSETEILLRKIRAKNVIRLAAANVDIESALPPKINTNAEKVIFMTAALLIRRKGHELALRALSMLPGEIRKCIKYVIFGDGPEKNNLLNLTKQLQLEKIVEFVPWLEHSQFLKRIIDGDVFLFPSFQDSGGMALLEAMSLGKPAICLDLGGPGEFVTDQCGFKIKTNNYKQIVSDIAGAIQILSQNPDLCMRMGNAAKERVEKYFTWSVNVQKLLGLYEEAVRIYSRKSR